MYALFTPRAVFIRFELEYNEMEAMQFAYVLIDNISITIDINHPEYYDGYFNQGKYDLKHKLTSIKILRNKKLADCDWTQLNDINLSNQAEWVIYRQALRDLPDNLSEFDNIVWPTPPT